MAYEGSHGNSLHGTPRYTTQDNTYMGMRLSLLGQTYIDSSGCLSTLPCRDKCMIRDRRCVIPGG